SARSPAIRFLTREAKWKAHQHMSATMTSSEESSLPGAIQVRSMTSFKLMILMDMDGAPGIGPEDGQRS
ncbi:hypothetical protein AAIH53_32090, partial [Pseudomonas aeruginosa]|uniref:hypothetical protein n=1 Tax=Pseudomonas aeruginosa TaxID=287 RepID=UPI0031B6E8E8